MLFLIGATGAEQMERAMWIVGGLALAWAIWMTPTVWDSVAGAERPNGYHLGGTAKMARKAYTHCREAFVVGNYDGAIAACGEFLPAWPEGGDDPAFWEGFSNWYGTNRKTFPYLKELSALRCVAVLKTARNSTDPLVVTDLQSFEYLSAMYDCGMAFDQAMIAFKLS